MSSPKTSRRPVVTRRARVLMASSALGYSLVVLASGGSAAAQEACGPIVDGKVVCEPGTYPTAVYNFQGNGEVILEPGATVTNQLGANATGTLRVTAEPDSTIGNAHFGGNGVTFVGGDTGYVFAKGQSGGVSFTARDVTGGLNLDANAVTKGDIFVKARQVSRDSLEEIIEVSNARDARINLDRLTSALTRTGILADAERELKIDVDDINIGRLEATSGSNASAIEASARVIDIDVGTLTAAGTAGSIGIYTYATDTATIDTRSINFSGGASAIWTDGSADTTVTSGTITATGGAKGIVMGNAGDQIVNSTTITTEGDNAHGIDLSGALGKVEVTSGSITATSGVGGGGARGITVANTEGPITIKSTTISADGYESRGIRIDVDGGASSPIIVNGGQITVAGQYSQGIQVYTDAVTDVTVTGSVTATGEETIGVSVHNPGHTKLDMGVVSANGQQSTGIIVSGATGGSLAGGGADADIEIHADSVSVAGDGSIGVRAQGDEIEIDLDDLQVAGEGSLGVWIDSGRARTADVTIRNANVTGSGSVLATIYADESIVADFGTIRFGAAADPTVSLSARDVTATVRDMVSASENAGGLVIEANETATLNVGRITTAGDAVNGGGVAAASITAGGAIVVNGLPNPDGTRGGAITTTGDGVRGLDLRSEDGPITVARLGSISTSGVEASAIRVRTGVEDDDATSHAVTLDIGAITTAGRRSHGVDVIAQNANITVGSVTAKTNGVDGQSGAGIKVLTEGQGAVTVVAGSVSTEGDNAYGIQVESNPKAETPSETTVTIRADSVTTSGNGATGVAANGRIANVTVGDVETTDDMARGLSVKGQDSASVTVLREVTTEGVGSSAITVSTMDDEDVIRGAVTVTATGARVSTKGNGATALNAIGTDVTVTGGSYSTAGLEATVLNVKATGDVAMAGIGSVSATGGRSRAIVVDAAGDIKLAATSVEATGTGTTEGFSAVDLTSTDGAIGVEIGALRTTGDKTHGIVASTAGTVFIDARSLDVTGVDAVGIDATSGGNMEIDVGAMNGKSTLIDATSGGDMTITLGQARGTGEGAAVLARSAGDLTFNVLNELSSTGGAAADIGAQEFVDFTVARGAVVRGDEVGVKIVSGTGTHLIIDGTVSAASGLALDIKGGAATINNNANTIVGRIDLTANNDELNNAGRFTAIGTSDFGAGSDVVNNTGRIDMGESQTPRSASFVNLERLNNAGVIDMSNGVAGDVFTLTGVLNGQAGNSVTMDLDLTGTPAADRLVAGGFEGVTEILLNVEGSGRVGDTGIVLARSDRVQTGAEIEVEVVGGGFVDYDLVFSGNAFTLQGELAPPAFEPTKIAAGAQHQWTSGADVVSARFEQMRDGGTGEGQGLQVWSQAFNGSVDIDAQRRFDVEGEALDADLTHEVKSRGVQAGVDRTFGDVTLGVLAGSGLTELRFRNGDRTRYDGLGLGAYGHWSRGPISIGAVAKVDSFDLDYNWAEAGMRTSADGSTKGVRVDASWRAAIGESWYLEPQASLSWSKTSLDRIESDTGTVTFGDTQSLVGRIGVRAGGTIAMADGRALRPYGSLHVLNEFKGDNASRLNLEDQSIRVRDEAQDAWARATMGASLGGATGLAGFVQAEHDFGAVDGFTARVGVRYAW